MPQHEVSKNNNSVYEESVDDAINLLEGRLLAIGGYRQKDLGESHPLMPMRHEFSPGMYIREIYMQRGMIVTTKIHKTEHFYVVSKGSAHVFSEETGWVRVEAPHTGRTTPGTRRVLVVESDMIWTTFHPTDLTDVAELEDELFLIPDNPILLLVEKLLESFSEGDCR